MSFTIGNSQKLISVAIKHAWCHGLIKGIPESAPIDSYVIEAARQQVLAAGQVPIMPLRRWSNFDLSDYRVAYNLMMKAGGVCNLSAAEWELYVFQPGNGASPLPVGGAASGSIASGISAAKISFLLSNKNAAKPGATATQIATTAMRDARWAAFLMRARPYNLPKADIENLYPGQFGAFKQQSEQEAWRITQQLATMPVGNRSWIENEIQQLVPRLRNRFSFV
jgi:hypothetical protein